MSLVGRFFRRAQTGPAPRQAGSVRGLCGRWGCPETIVWACDYVDRLGRRCETWCADHIITDGTRRWCERHANVVDRVRARADTIYDAGVLPDVDDRMPQLVWLTVEDMDGVVRNALAGNGRGAPGPSVFTDRTVRSVVLTQHRLLLGGSGDLVVDAGRHRSWQRGWGIVGGSGYVHRVSIRGVAGDDPALELLVDNRIAWQGVPDWIARRTGPTGRADFTKILVAVVLNELAGGRQSWQHYGGHDLTRLHA